MGKKYKAILVSHTHWDREWYLSFNEFRAKLIKLIDKLLHILSTDPEFKSFTLDGQTVILEDYLEIRPENREILKKYTKEGRILVGPWFVLCDEFLVSGEAIIRNLLLGNKIANEFGSVMNIGYIPDSFGHIAQMPQILSGFGLDSAIFTRGLGNEWNGMKTEFTWEALDGTGILAVFQKNGYGSIGSLGYNEIGDEKSGLPPSFEIALNKIQKEIEEIAPYASTSYLLFNNGCDHLEPQPEIPQMIKYINSKLKNLEIVQGTFEDFIKNVKKMIVGAYCNTPLQIKGELHNGKFHPILSGVFSTRIYLKQKNHEVESLLQYYVEPFSAISWLIGNNFDEKSLQKAWKFCLLNHPHDSICGCSIDQVHQEMMGRFEGAQKIGDEIKEQSLNYITGQISSMVHPAPLSNTKSDDVSQIHDGKWFRIKVVKAIVVFNSLGFERTDILRIKSNNIPAELVNNPNHFQLIDSSGKNISFQMISDYGENSDLAFIAEDVPSCGYKTFYFIKNSDNLVLSHEKNVFENEFFNIQINENGSLNVFDKKSNCLYSNLNLFEDTEDCGDEYDYSPAINSSTLTTEHEKANISLIDNGDVVSTYRIDIDFKLPESLKQNRSVRSDNFVSCPVTTFISIYRKIPRIDILTQFENNAKDHRIRVFFPTDIFTDHIFAETQFGILKREIDLPDSEGWKQKPVGTKPQKTFICLEDDKHGIAIINYGLPEYEVKKTKHGNIVYLTLLRSVGWLSRDDLLTRPYHAGPMLETPQAQCLGKSEFRYSIVPYQRNFQDSLIWQKAHAFNIPLIAVCSNLEEGKLSDSMSFLSIEPDNLILSALKKSENRDFLIVRLYNTTDKYVIGKIKFFKPVKKAFRANLNEEPVDEINVLNSNEIHVPAAGFGIVTFLVIRACPHFGED